MNSNQSDNQLNIKNINKVNTMSGWHWINEGYRYFSPNKYTWILSLSLVVMMVLISRYLLPILQIALVFIFPFIVAGLSIACSDIEKGKKISPQYLLEGFKSPNRMNLFRYGILFLIMMIIAQLISSIILNSLGVSQEQITNEIALLQQNKNASYETILASDVLFTFFITSVISIIPIIMINLFAPIVITFSSLSAFQAIKISTVAGLKNLPALVVYLLIYIVMLVIVVLIFNIFAKLLFFVFGDSSAIATTIYLIAFFGFILAILSVSYSSAYVAFKDIFIGDQI